MKNELEVFVPSHITGFFEIIPHDNPCFKGSRGAGIALDEGVTTHAAIKEGTGNITIKLNGKVDNKNTISKKTIEIIKERCNVSLSGYDIVINHESKLPIGAGFGTSACFALGISYALPQLLGINISYKQAGELAHLAEISLSTGLGDVISEVYGGCVIRLKEGSPVNGVIDKIPITKPIYCITKTIGLLETKNIIENPIHQKKINQSGSILLERLIDNPSMLNFIKLSKKFASKTQLISPQLREILDILDEETMGSSMAMLGNTAFALSYNPEVSIEKCNIAKINTSGIQFKYPENY